MNLNINLKWITLLEVVALPASAKNDPAEVVLAITEDGLSSSAGGYTEKSLG